MKYHVRNAKTLKRILAADFVIGGTTGVAGLLLQRLITSFLGLSLQFILIVSAITLLYAVVAFYLAIQIRINIPILRGLIAANWVWTIVSIVLLVMHYSTATGWGIAFLVLQVIVVGLLAWLEGRQLVKK